MSGGRHVNGAGERGTRVPASTWRLAAAIALVLTIAPLAGTAQEFAPLAGPMLPPADATAVGTGGDFRVLDRTVAPATAADAGDEIAFEPLPSGVLWEPPLANQREPRCFVKLVDLHNETVVDTAVGTVFSLARVGPANRPDEGFEIDVMAAVFTRIDDTETLTAADYRVGCPLTLAFDDWQFKLGYEHTSTHTGDVVLKDWEDNGMLNGEPAPAVKVVRDEIMLGVARRFWDQVRVYGQTGRSFADNPYMDVTWRFDWGVEWTPPPLGRREGGPYAAFDMELRSEQQYCPNVTAQLGWRWQVGGGTGHRSSCARLAVEYYNGKSPYGHFLEDQETWWALTAAYDW
jgi:hypothetical protein